MSNSKNHNGIKVLFINPKSNWLKVTGVETFDKKKNALNVEKGHVYICHPPCSQWSRLRAFAKDVPYEKTLAKWSILMVRKYGGVIEHPAWSKLFDYYLPKPNEGTDKYGGYSISVDMSWFGAKYKKPTWIYICGCERVLLPVIPLNFDAITETISSSKRKTNKKELSGHARSQSPILFCHFLKQIANVIVINKLKKIYNGTID